MAAHPADAKNINAKNLNMARPYALAAFEYARDKNEIEIWKRFLASATFIAQNSAVIRLLANPEIETSKLLHLFLEVLSSSITDEQKNFLKLLSQNKRFNLLPEINELFNHYLAALEKISKIRVVTALEIEEDFKQRLAQSLSKRIHHQVNLQTEVDPEILGGAIIHIGDRVIDGSIRGKLTRLLENLTG